MWPELENINFPGSFFAHKVEKHMKQEHKKNRDTFWTWSTVYKHNRKKKVRKVKEHRCQNFVSIILMAMEIFLV